MNIDFNITAGLILQGVVIVGTFVGQWFLFRHKTEDASKKIEYHNEEIYVLKQSINDMKLNIATNLVSKSTLSEVEARIVERMTEHNKMIMDNVKNLTDEFREVRKVLMSGK